MSFKVKDIEVKLESKEKEASSIKEVLTQSTDQVTILEKKYNKAKKIVKG